MPSKRYPAARSPTPMRSSTVGTRSTSRAAARISLAGGDLRADEVDRDLHLVVLEASVAADVLRARSPTRGRRRARRRRCGGVEQVAELGDGVGMPESGGRLEPFARGMELSVRDRGGAAVVVEQRIVARDDRVAIRRRRAAFDAPVPLDAGDAGVAPELDGVVSVADRDERDRGIARRARAATAAPRAASGAVPTSRWLEARRLFERRAHAPIGPHPRRWRTPGARRCGSTTASQLRNLRKRDGSASRSRLQVSRVLVDVALAGYAGIPRVAR